MSRVLKTFLEIAVWRKGPQDLPASKLLVALVLLAYVAVEFISVRMFDLQPSAAAIIICVDVLMVSGWLWLVLRFFGRQRRFMQTLTATLGVGVLILLLGIAMHLALGPSEEPSAGWPRVRLLIIALVMGRIFMQALDRGLITGMALTVAIVYSTGAVAQLMLEKM
jgi:hypothetical protein